MSIPLYLPNQYDQAFHNSLILAGDIGGTKSNLAIFKTEAHTLKLLTQTSYHSNEFHSAAAVIQRFKEELNIPVPEYIALGVAGPVLNNEVYLTNLDWTIKAGEIQQEMQAKKVVLLNDLEANAYGLAGLEEDDFITLHKGVAGATGNMAILAPGTGLGEAGLFFDGHFYHPFATEGGHCDFAPQSETDILLYHYMKQKHQHISWESVASGSAIHNLYLFLKEIRKREEPIWLADKLKAQPQNVCSIISETALETGEGICVETMRLFVRLVARESCNLVLKMKATGGLFLSGGIPPKNLQFFQEAAFYEQYKECDRMSELVESVPIKIIMNQKTPLLGAAYYGAFGTN